MTLHIRKLMVIGIIATVLLLANLTLIAAWIDQMGLEDLANFVRKEFLTGTAVTVIVALLILLVQPAAKQTTRCQVCDRSCANGKYCNGCGSRLN